jgi:predicted PurR-regulated permease PerM
MNKKLIFLVFLLVITLIAVIVYAQGIQVQQVPQTVETPQVQPQPAAVGTVLTQMPKPQQTSTNSLVSLAPDTFVSVKDHGDSQTVMIYKVDDQGKVRLTHKAKFFY